MELIARLPHQPLKSATGARLVLSTGDAGYPEDAHPSSPGRGRWFDNIANADTKTFLRACSGYPKPKQWKWPAVVLTSEECSLRVGGMSIAGLRRRLERYWGQGGVPGADDGDDSYKDMWVPGWVADGTRDPYDADYYPNSFPQTPLDPGMFSRWVNRECAQWLTYFIEKDHTFGAVHAWFAAFLGVTRNSLGWIAESFAETAPAHDSKSGANTEVPSHPKFRMSFDLCIDGHDELVDGIPSLPLNVEIRTNKKGVPVIHNGKTDTVPRRIWDVCANTVIPTTWFAGPPCPLTDHVRLNLGVRPVSHSWVANGERIYTETAANQNMWPVPLPKGVLLEDVRGELIRLGIRYAWLDVLCLRQQATPAFANGFFCRLRDKSAPVYPCKELIKKREQRRVEECKVDLPTIGAIFSGRDTDGLYVGGGTVIFMSGLGRPFRSEGWSSKRHWLRRAWTLQETPVLDRCLFAGLPGGINYQWDGDINSKRRWPWSCKVCIFLFSFCFLQYHLLANGLYHGEAIGLLRGR